MNNQNVYAEVNSIKIYHKTFMSDVFKVWNWIISNFLSQTYKVFSLVVPKINFNNNRKKTPSRKTFDTSVIQSLFILVAILGLWLSSVLFLIIPIVLPIIGKIAAV